MKLKSSLIFFFPLLLVSCGETKDPNLTLIGEHKFTMRGNSAYTMQLNIDKKEATFTYLYTGNQLTKTVGFTITATNSNIASDPFSNNEEAGRYGYSLKFENAGKYNTDSIEFNNYMNYGDSTRGVAVSQNLDNPNKGTTFYSSSVSYTIFDVETNEPVFVDCAEFF